MAATIPTTKITAMRLSPTIAIQRRIMAPVLDIITVAVLTAGGAASVLMLTGDSRGVIPGARRANPESRSTISRFRIWPSPKAPLVRDGVLVIQHVGGHDHPDSV